MRHISLPVSHRSLDIVSNRFFGGGKAGKFSPSRARQYVLGNFGRHGVTCEDIS
jgi:hypothetical protein